MRHLLDDFFAPERSLLRYVIGTAALTVIIQLLYDMAKESYGVSGAAILVGALLLIVIMIVWLDVRRAKIAARNMKLTEEPVTPHRGLIMLISPGNLEVPRIALEAHVGRLEHCWLIATSQSLATAYDVAKEISKHWPGIQIHDIQKTLVANPESVENTWRIVEHIYSQEAPALELDETDIVADITGGLKPMTAGMALACRVPTRKMQYIQTPRDKDGQVIPQAPRYPVLLATSVVS